MGQTINSDGYFAFEESGSRERRYAALSEKLMEAEELCLQRRMAMELARDDLELAEEALGELREAMENIRNGGWR